jgi:hypothetical protein
MDEELTKEEADKNIAILQEMNDLAKTSSKNVQQARMNEAPVRDVESSLASFTKHTFNIISEEYDFQKDIEKEIRARLQLSEKNGGFSSKELIALHTNNFVNLNDRVSKVLGPTFQLMTSEINADIAARAQMEKQQQAQVNISIGQNAESAKNLNENCGAKDEAQAILQGMFQLQNLLQGLGIKTPAEQKAEALQNQTN